MASTPSSHEIHAVTGALGYSGRYIAARLLREGHRVLTLTNSAHRPNPFGAELDIHSLDFANPEALRASLEGVRVLYNTYWVRFNHRRFTHAAAIENSKTLFQAAKDSGVARIVHVSITNPSEASGLEYFRGKAELEKTVRELGVSYAILRPTVLFGKEDILINNIAWLLRRLPVFGVFGDGTYRLQPIFVDDLAEIAVAQGQGADNVVIDAIGPETFTYRELVERIGEIIGRKRPIVSVPPAVGHLTGRLMGLIVGDAVITRDEIRGLMAELLYVDAPPAGTTKLTDWAREHAASLGASYASELARRAPLGREAASS
ncbi:MAG: NAD-dependent epimerase/dehydratase family protein [Gemmatimonadales bacterium]|nr:NAD-dependent epimerase/dehydratase family protein [Gemmatimonadales bacterium]NIN12277.1 NAD-dependent epimerase/dehydratase family protein [Gemmatimonadales bacterium]NIN50740.1 NAD-dependent epimerase/dehydratase family protein [Gemmatimonadales bacterium]NIP08204.1 NAD-dependent epimerase/dehydratase family protein [Gemmatimonadales bacterium]NIR03482.1 NAD-dependent epimerase/dehydratase family protein [Gemmatimonadales bacterium]